MLGFEGVWVVGSVDWLRLCLFVPLSVSGTTRMVAKTRKIAIFACTNVSREAKFR